MLEKLVENPFITIVCMVLGVVGTIIVNRLFSKDEKNIIHDDSSIKQTMQILKDRKDYFGNGN